LLTRVVELSSLTNGKTSGSEDEDLLDRNPRRASLVLGLVSSGHDDRDELLGDGTVGHIVDEDVEEELGVSRTGARLGVELNGEVRKSILALPDTLVRAVVGVLEELRPAVLERRDVDLERKSKKRKKSRKQHQLWIVRAREGVARQSSPGNRGFER
jgi:hypothetical protein